jgi:soluble lytic murein transglycosylase-like protein
MTMKKNPITRLGFARLSLLFLSLALLPCFGGREARAQGRRVRQARQTAVRQPVVPQMTLGEMLQIASAEAGISVHLLGSVVHQESGGRWWVVSPVGAAGLGQLMPGTAARFGVRNRFDPMQNLRGSARYLRWLLDRYNGDVRLALAGYNAGEGAVDKYGRRIPPYRETQNYVASIYPRFVAAATSNRPMPQMRLTAQTSQRQVPSSPRPATAEGGRQNAPADDKGVGERAAPQAEGARNTGASVYFYVFKPPASVSPSVLPK